MRRPHLIRIAAVLGLTLALAGMPGTAHAAPLPPTVTNVSPKSPSTELVPRFNGYTFYRHDPVQLFDNPKCSGQPLAIATVVNYGSSLNYYWYADVRVEPGSTTDVYARVSGGPNGTSPCSSVRTEAGHQVYKNTASISFQTKLTKKPAKVVKTTGKRAEVKFQFKAVSANKRSARAAAKTTYYCSMDGKKQRRCSSGVTYRVKRGKHTFSVAASKGGVTDPTPATFAFKVKKKKR